jgi:hypothetical protein
MASVCIYTIVVPPFGARGFLFGHYFTRIFRCSSSDHIPFEPVLQTKVLHCIVEQLLFGRIETNHFLSFLDGIE